MRKVGFVRVLKDHSDVPKWSHRLWHEIILESLSSLLIYIGVMSHKVENADLEVQ